MLMPVVDPDIVPPLVAHEYVEPLLAVSVRVAPGQSVVVPVIDAEQEQLITAGIFAFVKVQPVAVENAAVNDAVLPFAGKCTPVNV